MGFLRAKCKLNKVFYIIFVQTYALEGIKIKTEKITNTKSHRPMLRCSRAFAIITSCRRTARRLGLTWGSPLAIRRQSVDCDHSMALIRSENQ
jgi:hypothetical protein